LPPRNKFSWISVASIPNFHHAVSSACRHPTSVVASCKSGDRAVRTPHLWIGLRPVRLVCAVLRVRILIARVDRLLAAVMSAIEWVANDRNRLAHWAWATSEALRDHLLLVDPETPRERERKKGELRTVKNVFGDHHRAGGCGTCVECRRDPCVLEKRPRSLQA
jgi:hypothetical protein